MSVALTLHNKPVTSVFELLGTKENDITYSLGWALSQCPSLCRDLLRRVFPHQSEIQIEAIRLQEHAHAGGFTDIELIGPHAHVIVEAKRGWQVPGKAQMTKYADRLLRSEAPLKALVAMSECKPEFAAIHLCDRVQGLPVHHFGWDELARMTRTRTRTHAEKRLLAELRAYFTRIVKMQDQESNRVYVVSLSNDCPAWSSVTWKEIVTKHNLYFHPVGEGWPKAPPNYIAFRYAGCLQHVHHIDKYEVIKEYPKTLADKKGEFEGNHFLYTLGPEIRPAKTVKTGKLFRNGRVWSALDLLLTCDSISEARDKTKKRQPDE